MKRLASLLALAAAAVAGAGAATIGGYVDARTFVRSSGIVDSYIPLTDATIFYDALTPDPDSGAFSHATAIVANGKIHAYAEGYLPDHDTYPFDFVHAIVQLQYRDQVEIQDPNNPLPYGTPVTWTFHTSLDGVYQSTCFSFGCPSSQPIWAFGGFGIDVDTTLSVNSGVTCYVNDSIEAHGTTQSGITTGPPATQDVISDCAISTYIGAIYDMLVLLQVDVAIQPNVADITRGIADYHNTLNIYGNSTTPGVAMTSTLNGFVYPTSNPSAVPEPGSWLLGAGGLLVIVGRWRRR